MASFFMQYCATWSIYEIADDDNEFSQNSEGMTYEVDIISSDWLQIAQLFIRISKINLD